MAPYCWVSSLAFQHQRYYYCNFSQILELNEANREIDEDLNAQVSAKVEENRDKDVQIESLSAKAEALTAQLSEKAEAVSGLEAEISQTEGEIAAQADEAEALQAQVEKLKADARDDDEALRGLREELLGKTSDKEQLEHEFEARAAECRSLEEQLAKEEQASDLQIWSLTEEVRRLTVNAGAKRITNEKLKKW